MQKVFGGKLQTTYECLNCKSVSLHKECFTDLHLAVPEQKNTKSNSETTNTTIGKRKNIVLKQRLMPCNTTPSSGDIALYFSQEEYDTSLESSN